MTIHTTRDRLAEAFWQDDSMRASNQRRRVHWDDIGESERERWLRLADIAIAETGSQAEPKQPDEFKVEVIYRQTGTKDRPGGQMAGTPATLIRVTHTPTGIMAQFGEKRSQHQNRQVALEMVEWGLAAAGWKK